MSEYTTGPWIYEGHDGYHGLIVGKPSVCVDIAHVKTSEADAILIAAAPELLEALRDLEIGANTVDGCYTRNPANFAAALRDLREYAEQARAAIAKAEGKA